MAVSISKVSFEHHRQALGIAETRPRVSWRFDGGATDWRQSSYELEIIRGHEGLAQVHTVNSSESVLVPWAKNEDDLRSAERASVRVRAHGQEGQPSTPWSDWVFVETGLLNNASWAGAVPIAANREFNISQPKQPTYFRKSFSIDNNSSAIQNARLYITGLGLYEAEINGHRVGESVLAPGWQSYSYRHVYDTYDVTQLVRSDNNAIGVVVGEDLSWSAGTGPVVDSQIYNGETYDSRLEAAIEGWTKASFNDTDWDSVKVLPSPSNLVPADGPPVRRIQELKPEKIFKSLSGKTIVDFGQNFVGWLRVTAKGPSGTNITLSHAEVLEDGELALKPLRTADPTDNFILHGRGEQTWEPKFTFHGFRYVQIDNWPEETSLTADAIRGIVVHSDMEQTGWFNCSNPLLNQLHSNVRWSMKGNFVSIPTDCPQRDERAGWTGDVHAFGPTSNFLYNTAGFWRSWHKDVWNDMQRDGKMIVPSWVPATPPFYTPDEPTAVWGDVAVANPWNLWMAFGDKDMLREQYSQARAWIDIGVPRNEVNLWNRTYFQYGDWLDPLAPADNAAAASTSPQYVADAYLVRMTSLLANISGILGQEHLVQKYLCQSEDLLKAFREAWIQDGKPANETQTAYALGLYFDLFDVRNNEAAAAALRKIIADNNYLVGTGFAGTHILGHALHKVHATEDFYAMLLQTMIPSWLYQVVNNATTTWERWDSLSADGRVNPSGMTSFNHYSYGSVADWIHQVIGGLAPGSPGWKVIKVSPVPGGGITSATAKFISGYGSITTHWYVDDDGGFHLRLQVPLNSRAFVSLPNNCKQTEVGSGYHEFHDPDYSSRLRK